MNTSPEDPSALQEGLFPVSPAKDGYLVLPTQDPKSLCNFLQDYHNSVYDLDCIKNKSLNRVFAAYFKSYPRRNPPILPVTPNGFVRLFRGESESREEFASYSKVHFTTGAWWSAFLDDAVSYAKGGHEKHRKASVVYYVDIPEEVAQKSQVSRLGGEKIDRPSIHPQEFFIPPAYMGDRIGTPQLVDWEVVGSLLKDGEYTRLGKDSNKIMAVREKLQKLHLMLLVGFGYVKASRKQVLLKME